MDQYKDIAREYKQSKQLSFRDTIEKYSIQTYVGNVTNKRVLDLACGDGHYTRWLKKLGASYTVGVDLSPNMIALANEQEHEEPLGIKYVAENVSSLNLGETFDVVVAAYLLNYAKNEQMIKEFAQTIYNHLEPHGRFVTYNDNPNNHPKDYGRYRKYGFLKSAIDPLKNGDVIRYQLFNEDDTYVEFDNYYLEPDLIERAFLSAGFNRFEWLPILLEQDEEPQSFWADFLEFPPMICMHAIK